MREATPLTCVIKCGQVAVVQGWEEARSDSEGHAQPCQTWESTLHEHAFIAVKRGAIHARLLSLCRGLVPHLSIRGRRNEVPEEQAVDGGAEIRHTAEERWRHDVDSWSVESSSDQTFATEAEHPAKCACVPN